VDPYESNFKEGQNTEVVYVVQCYSGPLVGKPFFMRTEIVKILAVSVSAVSTIPGFDSNLSHCSDARSPAGISRRTRKLLKSLLQHL